MRSVVLRNLPLLLAAAVVSSAADPGWLDIVAPIITPAEKKLYLSLRPEERERFEDGFWGNKAITAEEYLQRIQYIDGNFGSTKPGSGANTDQGRVYLALGPPNKISHFPSSRIFVPIEIWYYSVVPGVVNTEVSLMFFQKNLVGFPKLYSPITDTIRALLIPQASTVNMFGPNDDLKEADIRNTLKVPPAEDEIVAASVNVASGIRDVGNQEILGKVSSPAYMLRPEKMTTDIRSRFITSHPKLDLLETASPYGGMQIDLGIDIKVQHEIDVQVVAGTVTVYQNQLRLKFEEEKSVHYTHRLDLLQGSYRVLFTVDGTTHPFSLEVKEQPVMSEILRADSGGDVERRQTPFEFDGRQLDLNSEGKFAIVAVTQPGKVTWMIRGGLEILWRSVSDARQIAIVELPTRGFPPGTYKLEAISDSGSQSTPFVFKDEKRAPDTTLVTFNANLGAARRLAFVGHQWLLKGKFDDAMRSLKASLDAAPTREAIIEIARVDASVGRYDEARDRLRQILAARPEDFEALSVLAYVEASLQDYPVAAELYRRALAVQDSPAIRMALEKLPQH